MAVLGVACLIAAVLFDLNATILLVGLMLIIAGVVKITMVALWHTVAGFGAPLVADDAGSNSTLSQPSSRRKGEP
jgi:disulfide bond formation protein DsbB